MFLLNRVDLLLPLFSLPLSIVFRVDRMLHGDPADVQQYLRWDKTGRLLLIPDEKEFVEKVCKVHFSQKSITSFVSLSFPLITK